MTDQNSAPGSAPDNTMNGYDDKIRTLNEGSLTDKINFIKSVDESNTMTSNEIVHEIKKHGLDQNDGITAQMVDSEIGGQNQAQSNKY